MGWIALITAALSALSQLIKLVREHNDCAKTAAKEMKELSEALKRGREKGDLSEVEQRFKGLGVSKPDS